MKVKFQFDMEKCSACTACAIACMDQNDPDILGGQQPYRRVEIRETEQMRQYLSIACLHCVDVPCGKVCPVRCIEKDPETGLVQVHSDLCIGCQACSRICPVEAPTFRPKADGAVQMEKCNGCLGRIQAGLSPACVQSCPTGAISWHWIPD